MSADTPESTVGLADQDAGGGVLSGLRIVSACTMLSRVLGLLREMAMAWLFGAGTISDAFTVAFRVPNLARQLLGEGALTTAFLPSFVRELDSHGRDAARRLATGMFWVLGLLLIVLVASAELVLAGILWQYPVSPQNRLLLTLLAILLPYLIVICLAAQLCAVLQSLRQFFWPAFLPVLLNVAWIASAVLVPWTTDDPETRVRWIAAGLVGGGLLQLGVPLWVLKRGGFGLSSGWRIALPKVRAVFTAMVPVVLGVILSQINSLLDSVLAWGLALDFDGRPLWLPQLQTGTASALYYGQRLFQFPLGVFGVALGTVLFPELTRHATAKNMDAFRCELTRGLRLVIAIGIPASIGLWVMAEPLTAALFQHGQFDAADAALTSQMVAAYGIGVGACIGMLVINRGFYALEDRRTPVRLSAWAVLLNITLALTLIQFVGEVGIALAATVTIMIQLCVAASVLQARTGRLSQRDLIATLWKTVLLTIVLAGICVVLLWFIPPAPGIWTRMLRVIAPVGASVAAYLSGAKLLRLEEPWAVLRGRFPGERPA